MSGRMQRYASYEWQDEMLILINLDTLFDQDPSLQLIEETQHSITPIQ